MNTKRIRYAGRVELYETSEGLEMFVGHMHWVMSRDDEKRDAWARWFNKAVELTT